VQVAEFGIYSPSCQVAVKPCDLRKSMDKNTLETLMFLHCIREHWNVFAVEAIKLRLGRNVEI
jgi:hypothetical protein